MKFNILHFLKISIIEIVYAYLIVNCYAVISMLIFGAGANSFMYSDTNGIIYIFLMIIPPTILNIYKAKSYWETNKNKSVNYLIVEILMLILTSYFATDL